MILSRAFSNIIIQPHLCLWSNFFVLILRESLSLNIPDLARDGVMYEEETIQTILLSDKPIKRNAPPFPPPSVQRRKLGYPRDLLP